MSDTNTMSTSARFAQIVSILRKHHIQISHDFGRFRSYLCQNWTDHVDKTGFIF